MNSQLTALPKILSFRRVKAKTFLQKILLDGTRLRRWETRCLTSSRLNSNSVISLNIMETHGRSRSQEIATPSGSSLVLWKMFRRNMKSVSTKQLRRHLSKSLTTSLPWEKMTTHRQERSPCVRDLPRRRCQSSRNSRDQKFKKRPKMKVCLHQEIRKILKITQFDQIHNFV